MTWQQIVVRVAVYTLLLPFLCALQYSGWLGELWTPLLLLALVPAVAMFDGPRMGAIVGFAAGLLEDCMPQSVFCFHSLLYMGAAFGMGVWVQTYVRKNVLTYYIYFAGLWVSVFLFRCLFGWWRMGGALAWHMVTAGMWKSLFTSALWGLLCYAVTKRCLTGKEA